MAAIPPPAAGTVIRYQYLWKRQADRGETKGEKARPVALIVAKGPDAGSCIVVPITHSEPERGIPAMEIPKDERERLGLDEERSWVVLSEVNAFIWPGPDLRTIPGRVEGDFEYGRLSRALFTRILAHLQTSIRSNRTAPVSRAETGRSA